MSFSISTAHALLEKAQTEFEAKLEALREAVLLADDSATVSDSSWGAYDANRFHQGPSEFHVGGSVTIQTNRLEAVDAILRAAHGAGADFSGCDVKVSDPASARQRAAEAATKIAHRQASHFARASGLEVGRVLHIEVGELRQESSESSIRDLFNFDKLPATSVFDPDEAKVRFSAAATITFELLDPARPRVMLPHHFDVGALIPSPPEAAPPLDFNRLYPERWRGTWRGWNLREELPDYPGVFFVPLEFAKGGHGEEVEPLPKSMFTAP